MYNNIKRQYWWSNMKRDIANFISRCMVCQKIKVEHRKPASLLQRLPVAEWKWDNISMDFIVGLPRTQKKHDSIWVIVDRLMKSARFLPIRATDSIDNLARLYVHEVVSPMKGLMRFRQKGKLAPRFIGPFEILDRVGAVAYRLVLPTALIGIHNVFHIPQAGVIFEHHTLLRKGAAFNSSYLLPPGVHPLFSNPTFSETKGSKKLISMRKKQRKPYNKG
ncbi:uncharacterized protein LOC131224308 [Magnolia sinica]|uniref:uncharacterized protein LOC131224308 n=1 Tax=Magnolia sinica TaxID=86752 RepID=UPI00265B2EE1|nr:uncharacterized protein LOC131224308 [Magnolia sinica]